MEIFWFFWTLFLFAAVCLFIRNNVVYKARIKIIDIAFDTTKGHSWVTASNAFQDGPSYNEMVLKFWKRPSSFYPEFDLKNGTFNETV